jgi:molybdopterin-guanine dinucleotide biosynthesis protein B
MKHAHHAFDVDTPGKDSFIHRQSGATEVMIGSAQRWALLHEIRDEPEPGFDALLSAMTPVDLLLIEGFKRHGHHKIEISRNEDQRPFLYKDDPDIVAIASDQTIDDIGLPVFDLNDADSIASFILNHTDLCKTTTADQSKEAYRDGAA